MIKEQMVLFELSVQVPVTMIYFCISVIAGLKRFVSVVYSAYQFGIYGVNGHRGKSHGDQTGDLNNFAMGKLSGC